MPPEINVICELCSKETTCIKHVVVQGRLTKKLCEDCFEKEKQNFSLCQNCDDWFDTREIGVYDDANDNTVCRYCIDKDYGMCASCNRYVHNDNAYRCENCDSYRCENCDEGHSCNNRVDVSDYARDCTFKTELASKELGNTIKSSRLFGVEIEAVGVGISDNEDMKSFTNALPSYMGLSEDGSVDEGKRGGTPLELQTPPVSGIKGENVILSLCQTLKDFDFETNSSCGLHVHIDGNDLIDKGDLPLAHEHVDNARFLDRATAKQSDGYDEDYKRARRLYALKSLFMFYVVFEPVILSFLPKSRRVSRFCQMLNTELSLRQVSRCNDEQELVAMWYGTSDESEIKSRKGQKYDSSRYYGVNFHSLFAAGHLEIRYHSGTVNPIKILEWTNLHLLIVDKAVGLELPSHIGEYAHIASIVSLTKKAQKMFELLGLSESRVSYFKERMKKFNFEVGSDEIIEG